MLKGDSCRLNICLKNRLMRPLDGFRRRKRTEGDVGEILTFSRFWGTFVQNVHNS